ncbi:MAG: hypothetical protein ACYCUY_01705 [Acidithiobacillus sp.]
MHDNTQDNQQFIDAARERGEDTFMYMDPKSGECLLVSGGAASIKLLSEIVDDYEMVCAVVEAIDTGLLERWRVAPCKGRECPAGCEMSESASNPESIESIKSIGDNEYA